MIPPTKGEHLYLIYPLKAAFSYHIWMDLYSRYACHPDFYHELFACLSYQLSLSQSILENKDLELES